jgi:urease accessory protein
VRARAAVVAEPDGRGGTRLTTLRSEAPLLLRPAGGAVYLVSGAAGPLGGDHLELCLTVRPGAALTVRTTAASVALPGRPGGGPSVLRVHADVGTGARLDFLPEPTIVAACARHTVDARLTLARGARLRWRDELILGRYGETGGACRTRLSADLAGRPLLRHALDLPAADPAATGPAVLQGHRATGSLLTIGPPPPAGPFPEASAGAEAVTLRLAGSTPDHPALLRIALAHDAVRLRALLEAAPRVSAAVAPR